MTAYSLNKFQHRFFEELEQQFSRKGEMIDAVSDALAIGRNAVYRRLRGETSLSADELMVLSNKFRINIGREKSSITENQLTRPASNWKVKSELAYYRRIEDWSYMIEGLPNLTFDYATSELPPYYEFSHRNLFAFKVYIYAQTCWGLHKWKGKPFRPELIDPEAFKISGRLGNSLLQLQGREIWSTGILDVTLRQIEYSVSVGNIISLELIEELYQEVERIIVHMEAMIAAGKRFPIGQKPTADSPDLLLYFSELMDNSNAVLFKSGDTRLAYTALISPSYLISKENEVIGQIERWIGNMISTANVYDAQSGRYATMFFARLRRQVAASKRRVDDYYC